MDKRCRTLVTAEVDLKMKAVRLLLLDVDGVLTRGEIVYSDDGQETKAFNVKDGLGIRLLMQAGIDVGIVTARRSGALLRRCRDLGISRIYDGVGDKAAVLDRILSETGATPAEIAFVGDDLPDIGLMRKVGLSIAPADAHEAVRGCADLTTAALGGLGAVREVCEGILKSKGLWQSILNRF
jgi:3-deoxy-D-manno-octulosonate 8-phosphate phosphatase (KDO 8-P phosphatase)